MSTNRIVKTLAFSLLMILPLNASGEVRFAGVFNSRCVLQRDKPLPVWGWGEPGEKVVVTLGNAEKETLADPSGKWMVTFDPMPAGGPLTLKASGSTTAKVSDVLIGEVWIGVGQSNMMMGVGSSEGGGEALKKLADYPNLRMAHEQGKIAADPEKDVKPVRWGTPNASSSAASFYFATRLYDYFKGEVPVGILNFTEIRPVEAWTDGKVLESDPVGKRAMPPISGTDSGRLFNGVVTPVSPFAIRGVLYYQGEMNGGAGMRFHTLMSLMIQSWRQAWNQPDLPFLFVQLPGFQDHRAGTDKKMDMDAASLKRLNETAQHGFIGVRQAQMKTFQTVPHTGMAVTIDVGMPWDIHPKYKRQVGERLFLQARHVAYGEKDFVFNGPIMKNVEVRGKEVVIDFDLGGSSILKFKDGQRENSGFMVAGSDGIFHPAMGSIQGKAVVLRCTNVEKPVMVRYGWAGYPETPLYNAEDLPAAPFEWIDYDGISTSSKATLSLSSSDAQSNWEGWTFAKGAELIKRPDGSAVNLPTGGQLSHKVDSITGLKLNSNPLGGPHVVRPGSRIGYEIEVASGEEGEGKALGFFRMAGTRAGNYFDIPNVEATSEEFSVRKIVLDVPLSSKPGRMDFISVANVIRDKGQPQKSFLVRNLSPITILQPELKWEGPKMIDLGELKAGASAASAPMLLTNGQGETLTRQITDDPSQAKSHGTVLYGLADVPMEPVERLRSLQNVSLAGNVGATLHGDQAGSFKLIGKHVTDDGLGLKLHGADGKPGLRGGPEAESETFTVEFKGAEKPGRYETTLRIVTQAANIGRMSHGADGEPPMYLFYLDIPVSALVK